MLKQEITPEKLKTKIQEACTFIVEDQLIAVREEVFSFLATCYRIFL